MKCNIIVNAWDPEIKDHCRRMAAFVENAQLTSELNMMILGEKESEESWGTLTELVPAGSVCYIVMPYYRAETAIATIEPLIENGDISLLPDNYFGNEMAVRLAVRKGGSSVTRAVSLSAGNKVNVCKGVYSGHIQSGFDMTKVPYFITVDKGYDESEKVYEPRKPNKVLQVSAQDPAGSRERAVAASDKKAGLTESDFIVAFGRGIKSKDNAQAARDLAEDMGADFGVSRPVVMNAWAPMENLIGASGSMTKPEVCIAAGVSGAPAFYAGIEKSKLIVAINSDPDAPIMKKSDVVVCGDWKEILEQLTEILKENKNDQ